jgi:hypothetical protein
MFLALLVGIGTLLVSVLSVSELRLWSFDAGVSEVVGNESSQVQQCLALGRGDWFPGFAGKRMS